MLSMLIDGSPLPADSKDSEGVCQGPSGVNAIGGLTLSGMLPGTFRLCHRRLGIVVVSVTFRHKAIGGLTLSIRSVGA